MAADEIFAFPAEISCRRTLAVLVQTQCLEKCWQHSWGGSTPSWMSGRAPHGGPLSGGPPREFCRATRRVPLYSLSDPCSPAETEGFKLQAQLFARFRRYAILTFAMFRAISWGGRGMIVVVRPSPTPDSTLQLPQHLTHRQRISSSSSTTSNLNWPGDPGLQAGVFF